MRAGHSDRCATDGRRGDDKPVEEKRHNHTADEAADDREQYSKETTQQAIEAESRGQGQPKQKAARNAKQDASIRLESIGADTKKNRTRNANDYRNCPSVPG